MSLFLVRAGSNGEYETNFIETKRICLQWDVFESFDLKKLGTFESVRNFLLEKMKNENKRKIGNNAGQINAFVNRMKIDDIIALPFKKKPYIAIGKICSDYKFDKTLSWDFQHYRDVEWINTEVPRSAFESDLLYSLGSAMTICGIERNDAENRVKNLISSGFQKNIEKNDDYKNIEDSDSIQDYETLLLDGIYNYIERKFKGHGMERLVEGILNAQGYKTWRTEGGPDGAMDILAAPDKLGFGSPRICVQVKSQDTPLDRPTLDQLRGGMNRCKATHGLLVCWGGFKNSVTKDIPQQFFEVRLWDKQELVTQLLQSYKNLDEDLRAEIPLKQVWMLAVPNDD